MKTLNMDYHQLWKNIENQSSMFTKNTLLKQSFTDLSVTDEIINDVFCNLSSDNYNRAMRFLRIFDNYTLESKWVQNLILNKPTPGDNASKWLKKQLGTDELFIILNYVERLNEIIAKNVSDIIQPLRENPHLPFVVCEADFIMGKYSQTPLGIHVDNPLGNWHRVLQINLGPGKKKMHFWDREKLQELMGTSLKNYFVSKEELKKLIPYADSYELEQGDALFFSPEEYHIAESDEYSISLGLVLFNEKKETFQKNALKEYIEDMVNESHNDSQIEKTSYTDADQSSKLTLDNLSWTNRALRDFQYKYTSNNYFKLPPITKVFQYNILDEIIDKNVSINKPFNMIYQSNSGGEENLFIRGRKLTIQKIPGLEQLIERLNKDELISVKEVDSIFDSSLEKEAILFLIKILYENGGILLND